MSDSTCLVCGVSFTPKRPGGKPQRYCSKEHYATAANKRRRQSQHDSYVRKVDSCWACGKVCRAWTGRRAFCGSDACLVVRNALRCEADCSSSLVYRHCLDCGRMFVGRPRSNRLYCTRECAQRAAKRSGKHRRRTAERVGDNITIVALGERDGWICHLCGKPITKRRGGDATSPSIDHLVPISDHGAHEWANVAIAHKVCNSRRHTGGTVQLRLM